MGHLEPQPLIFPIYHNFKSHPNSTTDEAVGIKLFTKVASGYDISLLKMVEIES